VPRSQRLHPWLLAVDSVPTVFADALVAIITLHYISSIVFRLKAVR
jgi:hypothetical protein